MTEIIDKRKSVKNAHEAGFSNIEEYDKAKAAGFNTIAEWNSHNDKLLRLEKQKREKKKLLAEQKRKEKLAECRKDLSCWAEKKIITAAGACKPHIERQSKYSFEWTDGFWGSKFSRYRWKNKPKGIVAYIGDKIKFQNGFGAWQNMIYECDYDPESGVVSDVRVSQGRLE